MPSGRLLQGLEVLVLNALWWRPHPTHLSIGEAIDVARALGAERTYLTHLTHETGHADLLPQLPPGVLPGARRPDRGGLRRCCDSSMDGCCRTAWTESMA